MLLNVVASFCSLLFFKEEKLLNAKQILSEELICLGSRLENSNFQYLEKHPWIIPGKSKFTDLLILKENKNLHRAVVSDTLSLI